MITYKKSYWIIPLMILVIGVWMVQYASPTIIGADGFLHGRMSLLIAQHGFLKTFPQAYFSWFRDHFSDKDFLYHLYLIPFTSTLGFIGGTKFGAFVATSLLFGTVMFLIKRTSSHPIGVFVSLALLLSSQFLRDTGEARPFVFAMVLTLLAVHGIAKKNTRFVFLVSLLYGMTHLSAWIIVFLSSLTSVVDWMMTGKGSTKLVLLSIVGYGASFLLHPNFPNNIFYTYLNGILVPWYAAKTGVLELGAEFFPLYTHEVIRFFPVLIGALTIVGICLFLRPIKLRREIVVWGLATILFGLLALVSRRNMTHLYPVFVVWLGITLGDWFGAITNEKKEMRLRILSLGVPVVLIFLIYSFWQTNTYLRQSLFSDRVYAEHFTQMAAVLTEKAPPGSRVFHTNWSDSQYFIGLAPEFQYIVTLDPIYMYNFDPKLYEQYRVTSFAGSSDPYKTLIETFDTRYGYAGKNYFGNFIGQVRSDKRFTILGEDELGIVFSLTDGPE